MDLTLGQVQLIAFLSSALVASVLSSAWHRELEGRDPQTKARGCYFSYSVLFFGVGLLQQRIIMCTIF